MPSVKTTIDKLDGYPFKVVLKNELEQPTGSFKLRGVGLRVKKTVEEANRDGKKVHIFCSSGGNAGLAAAYASQFFGVECTVVVPESTSEATVGQLKKYGANVVLHGNVWEDADIHLREMMASLGPDVNSAYCHPFDDEVIWQGHSELVDELVNQVDISRVKGIVLAVGGGGLYCGVVEGLRRHRLEIPILAMETHQTNCLNASVRANKMVKLTNIQTTTKCLAAPQIASQAWTNYNTYPTTLETVDDPEAAYAMVDFYNRTGKLVEPACGAAVSVLFSHQHLLSRFNADPEDIVVVIVCGGQATSLQLIESTEKLRGAQ